MGIQQIDQCDTKCADVKRHNSGIASSSSVSLSNTLSIILNTEHSALLASASDSVRFVEGGFNGFHEGMRTDRLMLSCTHFSVMRVNSIGVIDWIDYDNRIGSTPCAMSACCSHVDRHY